ncbi:MAG: GNAT family N-acetyltransferase [Acidobacteriota bacterium]|nr:MAG: GNAT family N-acetyltransferase [Acidobacteriota bacterium]
MLRKLEIENVEEISAIHRLAFPTSAWTRLGGKVVEEYYLWHLLGPHPIVHATGVFVDDRLAGFCISGVFNASTSGFLSKNRNLLVWRMTVRPWLVFDPVFLSKVRSGVNILNRFRKRNRRPAERTSGNPTDSFGILAIAVDPSQQGLGIGQLLMEDAERTAIELRFSRMDLTVNPENHSAIRFYEKLNWVKQVKNESWKGVMVKKLPTPAKASGQNR